jgi:hypothetical protein
MAAGGVSVIERKPDAPNEMAPDDLEVAMQDLLSAIESKDYRAMAAAFRAGFQILESAPHDEYQEQENQE